MMRALRSNGVASVALLGVILLATAIGSYILAHQRLNPPAWMPIVGESPFKLRVQLDTAQGILPGQGQAVNVSGVKVGDIASVDLVEGKAVATLNIDEQYARVYPDASLLLRPKTGLKDMVLELDPGTSKSGQKLASGALVHIDSSQTDVNFADFLSSLDGDTRDYLKLLVEGGGEALSDGGGEDLANTLRRLAPLSRHSAEASRLVAARRVKLRHVMTNLSKLVTELGAHDRQLARFVSGGSAVFRRFANQNENLAATVDLLPATLASGNRALAKLDRLGQSAQAAFGDLRPTARALGPTLKKLRPFFRQTVAPFRDQLRPFSREARPIAHELTPATRDFADSMPQLRKVTGVLNALFDEFAYDPPGDGIGGQGYLFFAPWAAHNTNSMLAQQDGIGPIRRTNIFIGCGPLEFLEVLAKNERLNPQLTTLVQLLNAPTRAANCPESGK
jgi:phospholipid/cholesterol/gamma-HCH transport system substrate-binding protein